MLKPVLHDLFEHPHNTFIYVFVLFLAGFALAGLFPAVLGLAILFGRCRIRWLKGRLRVAEFVGPFGWPRRMPRNAISKFVVGGSDTVSHFGPPGGLGVLVAHFENGVAKAVAIGYPRSWLESIAQDISARAGLTQSTAPPAVEVVDSNFPAPSKAVMEKPPDSPIVLRKGDAGITLEVPPLGIRKGSMWLFLFAIAWCVFIGLFTAVFLFGNPATGNHGFEGFPLFLFLGAFWTIGLGMLATSINLGKRRTTFSAGRSELTVIKSGPFGTKRFNCSRANIVSVEIGSSNVEVNHRRLSELQVYLLNKKKVSFLVGRDADELEWVAYELRGALGVEGTGPAPLSRFNPGRSVQRQGSPLAAFVSFVIFVAVALIIFRHALPNHSAVSNRPSQPGNFFLSNIPISGDPGLVFNSFGPSKSYRTTNAWAVIPAAHAEWFIPQISGKLTEITLAIEPDDGNTHPGNATVFIATDKRGFPKRTLETFTVAPGSPGGLATLQSVRQPQLKAGAKYWLAVRSEGGWRWHFNNQSVIHNAVREIQHGRWASAGDYCNTGAFSIRVETNKLPKETIESTNDDNEAEPLNGRGK